MTAERFPRRRPQSSRDDRRQENNLVQFTDAERRDKRYSVGYAIECARLVLAERRIKDLIPSSIHNLNIREKITLEELNKISSRIVKENLNHFHAVRKAS